MLKFKKLNEKIEQLNREIFQKDEENAELKAEKARLDYQIEQLNKEKTLKYIKKFKYNFYYVNVTKRSKT